MVEYSLSNGPYHDDKTQLHLKNVIEYESHYRVIYQVSVNNPLNDTYTCSFRL